jgi:hypothetical protein
MFSWYQLAKQSMSETEIDGETVVSETPNALVGAAVKYGHRIFVASHHFEAWDMAINDPQVGRDVTNLFNAAQLAEPEGESDVKLEDYEGFMTLHGFVKTREEATEIARKANQLRTDLPEGYKLQSEDIAHWAPQASMAQAARVNVIFRKTD